ncbi:hypothetical protein DMJ13_17985 [halophilic archaeon]|nr:hypothetical protein DMJ13_17985 [halophilic archaeon]
MDDEHPEHSEDTPTPSSTDQSHERTLPPELLKINHVYSALGHPRRRYLCYTLLEDTEWPLTNLATKVAAWENDIPESAVSASQHDRAYVSLYHAHVPKLVDEGVITFDEETETITAAEHAEHVLAALEGIGGSLDSLQEAHARGEMDADE